MSTTSLSPNGRGDSPDRCDQIIHEVTQKARAAGFADRRDIHAYAVGYLAYWVAQMEEQLEQAHQMSRPGTIIGLNEEVRS